MVGKQIFGINEVMGRTRLVGALSLRLVAFFQTVVLLFGFFGSDTTMHKRLEIGQKGEMKSASIKPRRFFEK